MKVVAFNGSPRKNGNTSILIETVFNELKNKGIETELIHVGKKQIQGWLACMKCAENQNGHCIIKNDIVNDCIDKIMNADGVILGSPVYCSGLTGQIKSFIDRVSLTATVNNSLFKRKIGASVVAVRRAGGVFTFNSLNNFFTIMQMMVVGSSYWNLGYGMEEGEVNQDEEGIQTMRNLGKNMAWLLKSIEAGKKASISEPTTDAEVLTNFIR
jgi:multimeric flavodoxin WrbA